MPADPRELSRNSANHRGTLICCLTCTLTQICTGRQGATWKGINNSGQRGRGFESRHPDGCSSEPEGPSEESGGPFFVPSPSQLSATWDVVLAATWGWRGGGVLRAGTGGNGHRVMCAVRTAWALGILRTTSQCQHSCTESAACGGPCPSSVPIRGCVDVPNRLSSWCIDSNEHSVTRVLSRTFGSAPPLRWPSCDGDGTARDEEC